MSTTTSDPLVKERLEKLKLTVSASKLGLWQQCRLKFFFRYVLALPKPRTPALHLGTSVHETLRQWNKARWRGHAMSLRELHDVYAASWTDESQGTVPWESTDDEEAQKGAGWRILETYFRESPVPANEKPEGVEVAVEADLAGHALPRLVGIIDLVQNGTIIDFKTCAQAPTQERAAHQHETQTTAYALLYREATGKEEQGIELHHLVKLKNPRLVVTSLPPATQGQQLRLFRVIESLMRGLDTEDFLPSPGMQCSGCEFFNECRAWNGS